MGIYKKSALLSLLRLRLEQDRAHDWQALQERERSWYLDQSNTRRWALLPAWLIKFADTHVGPLGGVLLVLNLVGLIAGFSLVAGLLEFQTFGRINLLWFMALAVFAPLVFWLLGLIVAAGSGSFPLWSMVEHRMPQWMKNPTLTTLLRQTAVVLSQQVSLLFAIGMLLAMLLYLLVTDLAFGWSSTLDISPRSLHAMVAMLSWPWQQLWPEAIPTLLLVEQTQYFRSAPGTVTAPAALGQWWRFLLMCLLIYVLLPRVVSYAWQRLKLSRMQARLFDNDALIAGWWQRMVSEALSQDTQRVDPLDGVLETAPEVDRLPVSRHVVLWGMWSAKAWIPVKETLNAKIPDFQLYKLQDEQLMETTINGINREAADTVLIVCKGWEPPTGELADFCRRISGGPSARFIWPVPLQEMNTQRIEQLNRSWRAFVPGLPEGFNLFLGGNDA